MFVKKDLRKVKEILQDESDPCEKLLLARRGPEFNGSLRILCAPAHVARLSNLRHLSLYGNGLQSASGIELLSDAPLEVLNLGNNLFESLPDGLGALTTLKVLQLDDNQLPAFPRAVLKLAELAELRLSGNEIESVPEELSALQRLERLSLDRNRLTALPAAVAALPMLKRLAARGNRLAALPEDWSAAGSLTSINVASNALVSLPAGMSALTKLTFLNCASNAIAALPEALADLFGPGKRLATLSLANNALERIPPELSAALDADRWSAAEQGGEAHVPKEGVAPTRLVLVGNPVVEAAGASGENDDGNTRKPKRLKTA
jgi:Leucine-rich repeat (LRR) protein